MVPETTDYQANAYELPEIWHDEWFGPDDWTRVTSVAALVPADARTLLDAGCGNGLFLRALQQGERKFDRLAGADRSRAALAHVTVEHVASPIDRMPFRDGEFDVVTSLEVIEHLPVDVYPLALAELARIARKYVVVSVPYREDLEEKLSTCPSCRARVNVDYHVRTFDDGVLRQLLDPHGFRNLSVTHLGETIVYRDQWLRERLRSWRTGPSFPSYAICPVCGYHDAARLRAELADRRAALAVPPPPMSPLRRLLSPLLPAMRFHRWACAVYSRV
jgi:SAM-dependent methyltransferase